MDLRRVSLLRRLVLAGAVTIGFAIADGSAEAQFRDGGPSTSRRALPAFKSVRPFLSIRTHTPPRRAVRLPRRDVDAGARRSKRPHVRPGTIVGTRPAKPPCGKRGTRPCSGSRPGGRVIVDTTPPPPRCGVRGRRPCGDTPPPRIVTPGSGDVSRYLGTLGTRQERAPPSRSAAATPASARQLLVLLAQSQPDATEDQIARAYRLRRLTGASIPLLDARAQVYRIDDRRSVQSVLSALAADPRVLLAQRNVVYQRQGAAGSEAVRAAQYGLAKIGAPSAHELATGRGVKVAVIDTGIASDHPDLANAVSANFDATGDDAGPDMHGTAIAGIIRARGLVTGVAPDATLLAVRAFATAPRRALPESTSFILLRALDWSVAQGARVINLSFSGGRDAALERIVAEATRRNVILVAAAGNGGPKAAPAYPAAYPHVIAVTAHDRVDKLYVHANRGNYITVAAPGVDILVPVLKRGHMFMSGTSMAAAYVTGIVALILERTPGTTPEQALHLLAETAEDLGPVGPDDAFGAGRVQARAALDVLLVRAKEIGARQ